MTNNSVTESDFTYGGTRRWSGRTFQGGELHERLAAAAKWLEANPRVGAEANNGTTQVNDEAQKRSYLAPCINIVWPDALNTPVDAPPTPGATEPDPLTITPEPCSRCGNGASIVSDAEGKRFCAMCASRSDIALIEENPDTGQWRRVAAPATPEVGDGEAKCPKCNGVSQLQGVEGSTGCAACGFTGTLAMYEHMGRLLTPDTPPTPEATP